ncbi:MAG: hypothetical protein AB7E55_28240, partial [Pigmentiphaga sp.]
SSRDFFLVEPEFDLFGEVIPAWLGKRGRPPFEPTDKIRNKVKLLLALGWATSRIAGAVGISPATLKRYFRAELKERLLMRDRLDARRFEIAMEQANAGNITALRELSSMIDRNDRMEIERSMGSKPRDDDPPVRVGKKIIDEQRAHAADADLMAELEREAAQNATH